MRKGRKITLVLEGSRYQKRVIGGEKKKLEAMSLREKQDANFRLTKLHEREVGETSNAVSRTAQNLSSEACF